MNTRQLVVFSLLGLSLVHVTPRAQAVDPWQDFPVAPTLGGSLMGVEIERDPNTGLFGILDSYVSYGGSPIRYSTGSGSSWSTTTVTPRSNGASRWGLAYHPVSGIPYVSYQDGGTQLVARLVGGSWIAEAVVASGAAGGSSLGFDPATGEPVVAFGGSSSILYAWHDSGGWHSETVDSGFGSFHEPSLQFDCNGVVSVAYAHTFDGSHLARRTGPSAWSVSLVESLSFPYHTVLEFNPVNGRPGIAYVTSMGAPVHFAEFDGASWLTSEVTATDVWKPVGLSYLQDGTPLVAYAPDEFGVSGPTDGQCFRLATLAGSTWTTWGEHFYGQWNWNGPVDMLVNGGEIYVAYEAVNIGTHLAMLPEPSSLLLFLATGLFAIRVRTRRETKSLDLQTAQLPHRNIPVALGP